MVGRGKFDRSVRFERPVLEPVDLGGEEITGWDLVEEAWAMVRYGTSEERRQAAGTNSDQIVTFRVRSTTALRGVTPACRIVFESNNYDISGNPSVGGPAAEIEFTGIASKG